MPSVIMHVNYCEQGQSIEEMCLKAVEWGFQGIEFRRERKGQPLPAERYLDEITAAKAKSGLQYVLFGGPGPDLMTADAEKREADLVACERFYTLAAERFALSVCNIMAGSLRNPDSSIPYADYSKHGSAVATEQHWRQATEGFRRLGDLAARLGFRFAFETHMGYLHDLPAVTKRLVDQIDRPSVGINLDYGNVVYFKGAPAIKDAIAICADKLYYVHLKNSVGLPGGVRHAAGLGEGDINQREFLRELRRSGYNGFLCVEAPRAGDREWYAKQDIAYIQSVLSDLGW